LVVGVARRLASLAFVLTSIDFFDELASGLPVAGAPELQSALNAGVFALTVAVFTAPQVLSLLVDTPLLIWAERRECGKMVALGIFGMAVSLIGSGLARSPLELGLAFALYAPASGLACGLAQAALMDLDPERREERMAGWALAGTLGDLLAAPAIAAAVWFSGSYRGAWLGVALGLVVVAVLVARTSVPVSAKEPEQGERGVIASTLGNRALLLWLAGTALCGLLDETFTAFGALFVADRFPRTPLAVAIALTACSAGSVLGLVLLRRLLLGRSPKSLLALSCLASVA
jgi:FSR family fosmidomycin resistance protein-like MFS transporter